MGKPLLKPIRIPLSAGQREDFDPKVASMFGGEAIIKRARNLILDRNGRLSVRKGVAVMSRTANGSNNFFAHQVFSVGDLLCARIAFGVANTLAVDYAVYSGDSPTGLNLWTSGSSSVASPLHDIQELFVASSASTFSYADCAVANGFLCCLFGVATDLRNTVVVIRIADGEIVIASAGGFAPGLALTRAQVVAVDNGTFVFAGVNPADGSVRMARFDPTTSLAVQASTNLFAAGAAITAFALAPVRGSNNVIGFIDRGAGVDATIHRADVAGTLVGTDIALAGTNTVGAAIESNNTNANLVTQETGGVCSMRTYLLATGALVTGPTALFGSVAMASRAGSPAMARSSDGLRMVVTATQSGVAGFVAYVLEATHAIVAPNSTPNTDLLSRPMSPPLTHGLLTNSCVILGTRGGTATHLTEPRNAALMLSAQSAANTPIQAATMDHGFACEVSHTTQFTPQGGNTWTDGSCCWVSARRESGVVTQMAFNVGTLHGRTLRQATSMAGQVFLAGGQPQINVAALWAESGFQDGPDLISSSQAGGGALELLGVYKYVAIYRQVDEQGKPTLSKVSEQRTVTMTGANNSVTWVVSAPEELRKTSTTVQSMSNNAQVELYRTVNGGEIFRLAGTALIAFGTSSSASVLDITADLSLGKILYSQGDNGEVSGELQDASAQPSMTCTATRSAIVQACLPQREKYQVSKRVFPGEPVRWSDGIAFFGSAPERIRAVQASGETLLLFSGNAVYGTGTEGPSDAGLEEDPNFSNPQLISAEIGIVDAADSGQEWCSIVQDKDGTWFQGAVDRLFFIEKNGSAPQWKSEAIRDTLRAYPRCVGAAFLPEEYSACWALQALTSPTEAIAIVRDGRTGEWFTHSYSVGASVYITSCCRYQGELVFTASDGRIYRTTDGYSDTPAGGAATFIAPILELNTIYPSGIGGEAQLALVELIGEYRGDCVLEGFVSYDDGKNYTSLGQRSITAAGGYLVGDTVVYREGPERRKGDGFRVKFQVTEFGGSGATEGLYLNEITLWTMAIDGQARRNLPNVA